MKLHLTATMHHLPYIQCLAFIQRYPIIAANKHVRGTLKKTSNILYYIRSRSVTLIQVNTPHFNPSQTGQY